MRMNKNARRWYSENVSSDLKNYLQQPVQQADKQQEEVEPVESPAELTVRQSVWHRLGYQVNRGLKG